jgi:hypothetical protein
MKIIIFAFICFAFSTNIFGQELHTIQCSKQYSLSNSSLNQRDSFAIGLSSVQSSKYPYYIRICLTVQTIDLFSQDNITYYGNLTNYIYERKDVKTKSGTKSEIVQYHYQKIDIDSALSTNVAGYLFKSGQDTIPSDVFNKSWYQLISDCFSIIYEYKINQNYSCQVIPCPWGQEDTILYVSAIQSNYNYLKKQLSLDSLFGAFENLLPKGKTYSNGSMNIYKMTEKESKAWEAYRPTYEYLMTLNDTLNRFLSDTLNKILIRKGIPSCDDDFILQFSKKGKLKNIYSNDELYWFEDKIAYYKCKRRIRLAFRKIKIDFIHAEYGFQKELFFIENKAVIR